MKFFNNFHATFSVVDCGQKMGSNSINMCPMTMKLTLLDSLAKFASRRTCLETLCGSEGKTYLGVLDIGDSKSLKITRFIFDFSWLNFTIWLVLTTNIETLERKSVLETA